MNSGRSKGKCQIGGFPAFLQPLPYPPLKKGRESNKEFSPLFKEG
jgi:hypothetical protein